MYSNNFIKKVAAFGLVLCMGIGSLDLTAFAATPTETVETDTSEVVSTAGENASADTDADVSVLSDKTVEEVSDLYTEEDLSEAAKTSNTAGLLVQLKDTEGTLPSILNFLAYSLVKCPCEFTLSRFARWVICMEAISFGEGASFKRA
ncbi:MAG: hypothetical protein JTJ12_05085 [Eubacterium sp.]|nr:hypothetical protein [Eubacterium sp.]